MTGPPPIPTSLLAARGSWRAKVRAGEPRPHVEKPTCPEFLKGEARAEWNRQCAAMLCIGILAKIDRAALACFCEAWAEFVAAAKDVAKNGRTYEDDKGVSRIHPMVKIKNEAAARVLHFAGQFGFTPSARARLRTEPAPQNVDPIEEMLTPKTN